MDTPQADISASFNFSGNLDELWKAYPLLRSIFLMVAMAFVGFLIYKIIVKKGIKQKILENTENIKENTKQILDTINFNEKTKH